MKTNYQNFKLRLKVSATFFFAFAFLFVSQNSFGQCPANITYTQQAGFGNNNRIVIGGYGFFDGVIGWNCYSDSSSYGHSRSFNMPSGPFVSGFNTPHWSSRIFQDMRAGVFRIQNGQNFTCYDSIQWKGIAMRTDGSVGIGTDNTFGYKLAVNGGVACKNDIYITQTNLNWPDYVFEPTYILKPLLLLEQEIDSLGHLPEMPSANEVENEGLSMTTVTTKVVQKVEELTLYTIDQQKQLDALKKQNELLQKQNEELKTLLDSLLKEKE
jgi:hypothetical protein